MAVATTQITTSAEEISAAQDVMPARTPVGAQADSGLDPSLSAYIREVSQHELLSHEEEVLLFAALSEARATAQQLLLRMEPEMTREQSKQMRADTLRYEELSVVWEDIPRAAKWRLSPGERRELLRALSSWSATRERITLANLRLVIYVTKRHWHNAELFLDLIQDGNIGLLRAIDRYDPAKTPKFAPYAVAWIHQAAARAYAKQAHMVRVPQYKRRQIRKYERAHQGSQDAYLWADSDAALQLGLTAERLEQIEAMNAGWLSTANVGDDVSVTYLDSTTAADENPEDHLIAAEGSSIVEDVLDRLPPREAKILRWRFGIGVRQRTVREIAEEFGVSCERIRQLKKQALDRLGQPGRAPTLAERL